MTCVRIWMFLFHTLKKANTHRHNSNKATRIVDGMPAIHTQNKHSKEKYFIWIIVYLWHAKQKSIHIMNDIVDFLILFGAFCAVLIFKVHWKGVIMHMSFDDFPLSVRYYSTCMCDFIRITYFHFLNFIAVYLLIHFIVWHFVSSRWRCTLSISKPEILSFRFCCIQCR